MEDDVRKKFTALERRVKKLESKLAVYSNEDATEDVVVAPNEIDTELATGNSDDGYAGPDISFRQVITFLGVLGVIIGLISFFFYAVANNLIGEAAQILLGMVFGLVLFGVSYYVKDSNPGWAKTVFGGALFIELLSISVGVNAYEIMPPAVGLLLSALFIVSSLFISVKFESRLVAYFAVAGGYLLPFITGYGNNDLFILILNTLFTAALVVLSYKQKWADLRFTSFIITTLFILSSHWKFMLADFALVPILYLIVIGLLFHLSTLVGMLQFKDDISAVDSIIAGLLPVIIFASLYPLLDISLELFGLIILAFAVLKLFEISALKQKVQNLPSEIINTFLSAGFIILNLGIVFMIHQMEISYFIMFFAAQQALFMYLSRRADEVLLYKIFSYVFLGLTLLWFMVVLALAPGYEITEASVMVAMLVAITGSAFVQYQKDLDYFVAAGSFIIFGFLTLFNIAQYVELLSGSREFMQIFLSIAWLVYTIFMYTQVQSQAGKVLTGILLGITLCKIAFVDLFFLDGVYRIVGFIIFGILLLIGGYFIGGNKK